MDPFSFCSRRTDDDIESTDALSLNEMTVGDLRSHVLSSSVELKTDPEALLSRARVR